MKKIFFVFVAWSLFFPSLWAQNLPNPNKSSVALSPGATAEVWPWQDRFYLRVKSAHHPLLNRSYSPYSSKSKGFGKGWSPSYAIHLKSTAKTITLVSPHGDPLVSFQKPLGHSKNKATYRSPITSHRAYKSTLPVPIRLTKAPSAFVLNLPGGARYRFSPKGRLESIYSPLSGRADLHYKADGLLERIDTPGGKPIVLVHSPKNHQITAINSSRGQTKFTYDSKGQLEYTLYPTGGYDSFSYDNRGRLHRYNHRRGHKSKESTALFQYTADRSGRIGSIENAKGDLRKYKYLPRGLEVRDQRGLLYKLKYRAGGKRIDTEGAFGKGSFRFNSVGQLTAIEVTPKNGKPYGARFHYTPKGHIARAETFGDIKNTPFAFSHDMYGRLTEAKGGDGTGVTFEYPKIIGGMVAHQRGKELASYYDDRGRIYRVRDGQTDHRLYYDGFGALSRVVSKVGKTTKKMTLNRNKQGLLNRVTVGDGRVYQIFYNKNKLAGLSGPEGFYLFRREDGKLVSKRKTFVNGKDGKMHLRYVSDPGPLMLGSAGDSFGAVLRDKSGAPRMIIRGDGRYKLLLQQPGEKYTLPKGWASKTADWLDQKIDVAQDYWGKKLDPVPVARYGPGFGGFLMKGSTDSLRLGEGMYRAYVALGKGNYGTALWETGMEGLRVWGIVGGAGGALKGAARGGRVLAKGLKSSRLAGKLERALSRESRVIRRSGKGLSEGVEKLKGLQKEWKGSLARAESEGAVDRLLKMKGGKIGTGLKRGIHDETSLMGQCGRIAENIGKQLKKEKGYTLLSPSKKSMERILEKQAVEMSKQGKQIALIKTVSLGNTNTPHLYLKLFHNGKVEIFDPSLSGNLLGLYKKTNVPLAKKGILLPKEISGYDYEIIVKHQWLFTPKEHQQILKEIKKWKLAK